MADRPGLVLLDKPAGMTSHDVVARFRRASGERRTGHTGTLDPMATGLLILCVGRATRLQSFLTGLPKTYAGEIQFGWSTDTYDREGAAAGEETPVDVEQDHLERVISERFTGSIQQVPPAYSAKKVEGRRAYELARKGTPPVLEPRSVEVSRFTIDRVEGSVAHFVVECSAGTYVRSLAHDLGEAIGVPAHLRALRRTDVGRYSVEQAIDVPTLDGLTREAVLDGDHFIAMGEVDLALERVLIDPAQEKRLLSGQSVVVRGSGSASMSENDLVSLMNLSDELVAIGQAVEVTAEGAGPMTIQPRIVLKEQR